MNQYRITLHIYDDHTNTQRSVESIQDAVNMDMAIFLAKCCSDCKNYERFVGSTSQRV